MFSKTQAPKLLLLTNAALALGYFILIAFFFERGYPLLFWLLVAGEIFHLWQALTFIYTIWDTEYQAPSDASFLPPVDVFITVAGEPAELVSETLAAALAMDYPHFTVYILNDSFVAKKPNWREIEHLAHAMGAKCITRTTPGGYKAGNINHALRLTTSPFVAIFDADHVPHADFLRKTMGYFAQSRTAFVQSPQYYKNQDLNFVTSGAWEQQALFFGPICKGKNRLNAATMCGTNMVIRRQALLEVGGMCEESIAEDFLTGCFLHERGWRSVYVAEVLAEGLAPEDFLSYYKQQFRWARGSMDLLFRYNPLFRRGLSWSQKIQYLSSVSFFFSGAVVLTNALIPLIFFFTGLVPFTISTMSVALIFLPYMFLTLYTLERSSNYLFTYQSLAFSMAGFNIHLSALWASLRGVRSAFAVTSKQALTGNFWPLVIPQLCYIALAGGGALFALATFGLTPSVVTNIAWAGLNVSIFSQFVNAALPQRAAARAPSPALSASRLVAVRPAQAE